MVSLSSSQSIITASSLTRRISAGEFLVSGLLDLANNNLPLSEDTQRC